MVGTRAKHPWLGVDAGGSLCRLGVIAEVHHELETNRHGSSASPTRRPSGSLSTFDEDAILEPGASLHGTDQTETVTIDASKLVAGTHYVASTDFTQSYSRLLSGVPLGKITASGLYGPYDPAARSSSDWSSTKPCSPQASRRSRAP
ncbi:hypothetical protein GCM10010442_54390 [Kitasatospora kifunensis]